MNGNELSGGRIGFVGIRMCSDTDILSLRSQQDIWKEREHAVTWKARLPFKGIKGIGSGSINIIYKKECNSQRETIEKNSQGWLGDNTQLLNERKRQMAKEIQENQDAAVEPGTKGE